MLPGVTVEVRSTAAGGAVQTAITDVTGMFTITALQSGTYNVALTLPGFSTFVRDGVKISAGATVALDVVMSVEGIQQHVVVVGSRAQPLSSATFAPKGGERVADRAVQRRKRGRPEGSRIKARATAA